jgi:hypothetical protein
MEDIKEILVFISFSFGRFFINMASHLGLLFLTLALTLPVYFIGYKSFGTHSFFAGYLVFIGVLHYMIRKFLFFRHQLILNVWYVRFLGNRGVVPDTTVPLDLRETLSKVRSSLKKTGHHFLPAKLLVAITAPIATGKSQWTPTVLKQGKKIMLTYLCIQWVAVIVMWVPFGLISFLFTMGLSAHLQFLIYLLGFFFAYFLNTAILDPFIALLVQKRIYALL